MPPRIPSTSGVSIRNLSKRYGGTLALDDLSLEIPRGTIFGLLGMNGAGKTTTMEILATLSRPTSGDAIVAGSSVVHEAGEVREKLAIVFEGTFPARPHWTVREYLTFFQELRGGRLNATLLRDLGIEPLLPRPSGGLSGGEKKRVELARALMARPQVLLLDEPTKEIDLKTKRVVWDTLREACRRDGITIILSSHDVVEMKELCESIAVLRRGKLASMLAPDEVRALTHATLEQSLVPHM